jgi:hypothetical protein
MGKLGLVDWAGSGRDLENLSTVWWLHLAGMVEPSRSSADDVLEIDLHPEMWLLFQFHQRSSNVTFVG